MSEKSTFNEQEVRDIIQCYLDSDKKIDLCQINYIYRYPRRKKPSLPILKKMVQNYKKSGALSSENKNDGEVSGIDAIKDNGILKYFLENTHASVKKAASIFHAKSSYIEKLLEDKKAQIESKNEDNEISNEDMSLNDCIGLDNSKIDQAMVNDETQDSDIIVIEDNMYDSLEIKTEIDIVEHDPSDFMYQQRKKVSEEIQDFQNIKSNKRKPEMLNSELNKKSKSYLQTEDTTKSEIPFDDNLFVYTTRLEDMAILKRRMKKFTRAHIIKEILLESKPKFYLSRTLKTKLKIRKRRSLNPLKKKLKYLVKNISHPVIDLTEDVSVQSKCIIHDGNPDRGDLKVNNVEHNIDLLKNYKLNLVIVIYSKNLALWDIYVIDSNGNIVEYHSTKTENVLNEIDPSIVRFELYTCCWYQRRYQIDKTLCDTTFARFLSTTHKCPPDLCTCCCKPKYTTSESSILKNVCVNARSVMSVRESYNEKDKKNLINKALMYERKFIRNNDNLYVRKNDSPPHRFLFSEEIYMKGKPTIKTEFYEIASKQDIIYQAIVFNTGSRAGADGQRMLNNIFPNDTDKLNYSLRICCKFKRDKFLFTNYSAGNISESVLRYLRNTKVPFICDYCEEKKNNEKKNSNVLSPLLNVPCIEHTKALNVYKVGLEDNKSYEQQNFDQTLPEDPSTEKSAEALKTPREEETDQLELNCKQIPGFVFTVDNVEHQLAMAIVKKCTTFDFTITKAQEKFVASLNLTGQSITMQSTSTDVLKIMANILLNVENRAKDLDLPSGTNLSLEVKIKTDNTLFQNCRNDKQKHSSFMNIIQNICEDTKNLGEVNTKPSNINNNNTRKTNDRTESLEAITADSNNSCQFINDTTLNENVTSTQSTKLKDNTQNRKKRLSNSTCNQKIATKKRNPHKVSQGCDTISVKEITENFYKYDHANVNLYNNKYDHANVNVYNNFKNLMISNKKCSANSFRLYREAKQEKSTDKESTPLIVDVFSLKNINIEPNEPSISNDLVTNIIAKRNDEHLPSTSKVMAHVNTEKDESLFSMIEDIVRLAVTKINKPLPSTSKNAISHEGP